MIEAYETLHFKMYFVAMQVDNRLARRTSASHAASKGTAIIDSACTYIHTLDRAGFCVFECLDVMC